MNIKNNCHCACGKTAFSITGAAITRVFCHCTICQGFNQASHADVTLFYAKDVTLPCDKQVEYKKYRRPPAVSRGKCRHCRQPAIELLSIPFLTQLVIIPTANIHDELLVPEPEMHIFYEHCTSTINDGVRKYEGYWRSQLALLGTLV